MIVTEITNKVVKIRKWVLKPDDVKVLEENIVPQLQDQPHAEGLVPHHVHEDRIQVGLNVQTELE